MQWLVDLVLEYLRIHGLAADRGDPAAFDFGHADLTLDGAWHDMDLSSIIPENVTAVYLFVQFKASAVGRWLFFRTKGNVNLKNKSEIYAQLNGVMIAADMIVFPNENRMIQYNASPAWIDWIRITIKGWDF